MLPEAPARLHTLQAAAAVQCLGRIPKHHVIRPGTRFQRQRQRGAAGLGYMDENVLAGRGTRSC